MRAPSPLSAAVLLGVRRWRVGATSRLPRRCCAPGCEHLFRAIRPGEPHHVVTVRRAGGSELSDRRLHADCRARVRSGRSDPERFDRIVDGINSWVGALVSLAMGGAVLGWVYMLAVGK